MAVEIAVEATELGVPPSVGVHELFVGALLGGDPP